MVPPPSTANRNNDVDQSNQHQYSDEKKRQKKAKKDRLEMLATVRRFTTAMRVHPDLYTHEEVNFFREDVAYFHENPNMFPPPLPPNGSGNFFAGGSNLKLTCGVSQSLRGQDFANAMTQPILQACFVDFKKKIVKSQQRDGIFLIAHVRAVDGDGRAVLLKFDHVLSSRLQGTLDIGSLVQLINFHRIDQNDKTFLLVRNCRILGNVPVAYSDVNVCEAAMLSHEEEFMELHPEQISQEVEKDSCGTHVCDGSTCSKYGLRFDRCVTECFPVDHLILTEIARSNPFVDMEVSQMENNNRRFILYHWYATNIYNMTGKGNRAKLPDCLIAAIRAKYKD